MKRLGAFIQWILPSPFTIAIILSAITFVLALSFGNSNVLGLFNSWKGALGNSSYLAFAFQMMLMLVLGHALAMTETVDKLLNRLSGYCRTSAKAAFLVSLVTLLTSLFNWGLGLIVGALFAKKVGELSNRNGWNINYPLVGAAGYCGLMIWHGGLSGSAPLKIAEEGHYLQDMMGVIPISETLFSPLNIITNLVVLLVVPLTFYLLGKRSQFALASKSIPLTAEKKDVAIPINGAQKLDHSPLFSKILGILIMLAIVWGIAWEYMSLDLKDFNLYQFVFEVFLPQFNPNFINLLLLVLCFLFHKSFNGFLEACTTAIKGSVGILIQFPLYFGIMGIMKSSGLVEILSHNLVSIANEQTFPLFTFFSAGIVNIFVPSGGGQWAVQGPIVIEAAKQLNVGIPKTVMALAYGDQITNMLQPFWALPLLGITKIKAQNLLPYTLVILGIGSLIYGSFLLFF
ncbi:MAG: TIGR00366 family protein [Flavobacteriales bacterium]|nr:TIGR00366 family protein [Flavobacteriales bacterium]